MCFSLEAVSQPPSPPVSQIREKAGKKIFVDVDVRRGVGQESMELTVQYSNTREYSTFICRGTFVTSQQKVRVGCDTSKANVAGEYHPSDAATLSRVDTGESKRVQLGRLPLITLYRDDADVAHFPSFGDGTIAYTEDQALVNAADRARAILDAVYADFPINAEDSKKARDYLIYQAEVTRLVIASTRTRYEAAKQATEELPLLFVDFERRIAEILRQLRTSPLGNASALTSEYPLLVRAQHSSTNGSVTVRAKAIGGNLPAAALIDVLLDMDKGLRFMGESGARSFTWSVTSIPSGAEVWYSHLGEPEVKWAGVTDIKDQSLPFLRWTFRIDWGGCSLIEHPNPFRQAKIEMKVDKKDCKKQ